VLRLIGGQAGRISAIGIGLGVGLGWLGTQVFLSLVGGPAWHIDWIATAGVAGVFALTIVLASCGPAWRAVRLEPSAVLHQD
jgi:ABC-type antimicrobial peptide transport system permease subunit